MTGPHEDFLAWVGPRAAAIDRDLSALRSALAEMGRRGLLGLRIPARYGGRRVEGLDFRRFQEALARASGALAFLQTQHQSACSFLVLGAPPALQSRLLPELAAGRQTSGVAFSHLRRPGPPMLRAEPTDGGWRLAGSAPWVTGWGLFDRCVTAATLPDGRVLFFTHPLAAVEGLSASPPLALAACEVAQTVTLDFAGLLVPSDDALGALPLDWVRARDRASVALQSPFALGCAGAGLDALRAQTARRDLPAGPLDALSAELDAVRADCYAAMASGDFDAGLAARTAAIALMGRCAHAAVAACAGGANLADAPAQRIWREALLFTVLAQTRAIREGTLARLGAEREGASAHRRSA